MCCKLDMPPFTFRVHPTSRHSCRVKGNTKKTGSGGNHLDFHTLIQMLAPIPSCFPHICQFHIDINFVGCSSAMEGSSCLCKNKSHLQPIPCLLLLLLSQECYLFSQLSFKNLKQLQQKVQRRKFLRMRRTRHIFL